MTEDNKEKKLNIDFEPFKPINTSLYLCDNKFHTEALNELLESDQRYGCPASENLCFTQFYHGGGAGGGGGGHTVVNLGSGLREETTQNRKIILPLMVAP